MSVGRRAGHAICLAAALGLAQGLGVSPTRALPATLSGQVQYETFGYPDPGAHEPRSENFFEGRLRGSGRLTSTLTFRFEGRAVADDVDFTAGGYSLRNAARQRPYLSVITGVLEYHPIDALRISVGKQIVNWSAMDEIQPANLMTPRDESDVFRRVELGVPGVSVHYTTGEAFADLMVVPLAFTPSRLPQGRWDIIRRANERQDLPPVRFDETQAGLRVGARIGQLDASVIGYVGRDFDAVFVPNLIFVGGIEMFRLEIIERFPRLRAGGVTASYPLGERTLLRTEAVYYNSPDRVRDDLLHSVAGIEYTLADWRLVLNYMHEDQTLPAPDQVMNKGERRFFRSFLFGEIRYDNGRLRGRVRGGYDLTEAFLILQPEISYRLWRELRIALVVDAIDAHRPSYFDQIRRQDRVGTRLEYHF